MSGRPAGLLLSFDGTSALVVHVDKQQLNRALVNLFDNADLHGTGLTAVHIRRSGQSVLIDVDDDGAGVSSGERARIFERFVRGGSRGSRPGAGLGLSLVAETARGHAGVVTCTDSPSGGARFTLRLPLAAVDAERLTS
jgi:signal transduction histidine kinase